MSPSASRREVLAVLLAATAGAAATAGVYAVTSGPSGGDPAPTATPSATGTDSPAARADPGGEVPRIGRIVDPHGDHQAGIATPAPARTEYVAFDLLPGTDAAALGRLMRVWTPDIRALAQARPALGDRRPEIARDAASLTVTVGLGPAVFDVPGLAQARPTGLVEVPAMSHDRLEPRWSGGDLLLQVGADDALVLAHAVRRLVLDAEPFATVRWRQSGFWRSAGIGTAGSTGRNLMGQMDGTGNVKPGSPEFEQAVWVTGDPAWLAGGTTMVLRRIRMDLPGWDQLGRAAQEAVVGRRLDTGAPLGREREDDDLPLDAVSADSTPLIATDAHARLAHPDTNAGLRIVRRGHNYLDGEESGLLFVSFQQDIGRQFIPIQRRLDAADALNAWTTATGSAVFAVPPGFGPRSWIGEALLA
jgi:dye decolorizing peroxidase